MYRITRILINILCLVGIVILSTGCTTTHELVMYKKFPEGKKASITLMDGETIDGKNIIIGVDSAFCIQNDSKTIVCIPQSEVKEIRTKNYVWGAMEGCLLGVFIVPPIVGAAGASEWEKYTILVAIIIGVPAGVLLGLISGAIKGHTDKYIIDSSLKSKFVKIEDISKKASEADTEEISNGLIRVKLFYIVKEDEKFITFQWRDKFIRIYKSDIQQISRDGKSIYIVISKKVFEDQFK